MIIILLLIGKISKNISTIKNKQSRGLDKEV